MRRAEQVADGASPRMPNSTRGRSVIARPSGKWSGNHVADRRRGGPVLADGDQMPGARFFPEARLNFAENLLRQTGAKPVIFAADETGRERTLSADELREAVRRAAAQLKAAGVKPGDRVAGVVGNTPEAVIAALGAATIGAIWSSCSPDFGVAGILDRFGQITPVDPGRHRGVLVRRQALRQPREDSRGRRGAADSQATRLGGRRWQRRRQRP